MNVLKKEPLEPINEIPKLSAVYESCIVDPETFVTIQVRYEPHLAESTFNDPKTQERSANNLFLIKEHYELLCFLIDFYGWHLYFPYDQFEEHVTKCLAEINHNIPHELTITLDPTGRLETKMFHVLARTKLYAGLLPSSPEFDDVLLYSIYIDNEPTIPSPNTTFPTSNDAAYRRAYKRITGNEDLQNELDVLLYNPKYELMSGCMVTIAIFRDGRWYTPHLASGARCDALRNFLLKQGFLAERTLALWELRTGESVLVLNPIIGIARGYIANAVPSIPVAAASHHLSSKQRKARSKTEIMNAEDAAACSSNKLARTTGNSIPGVSVFRF